MARALSSLDEAAIAGLRAGLERVKSNLKTELSSAARTGSTTQI